MKKPTLDRVVAARRLYFMAKQSFAEGTDSGAFCAALLLQDAVEVFLLATAIETGTTLKEKAEFQQILDEVSRQNAGYAIPRRTELIRLNKLRVNAKHHAFQPQSRDVLEALDAALEAFNGIASELLHCNFATISAMDLIDEGNAKAHLSMAIQAHEARHSFEVATRVRMAIYEMIESKFDVSAFVQPSPNFSAIIECEAPIFARDPQYINQNVHKPTDYIQLDRTSIEQTMLKAGIDTTAFWNLMRLTPNIWRNSEGVWHYHWDLDLMSATASAEHAQYILDTGVDIIVALHTQRRKERLRQSHTAQITVSPGSVMLYRHASTAEALSLIPPYIRTLNVLGFTNGFDGPYWHVWYPVNDSYAIGYIRQADADPNYPFDPKPSQMSLS